MFYTPDQWMLLGIAFIGTLVSSVFGFGSALILILFGSLIFPIKETIAITTIFFLIHTVVRTLVFREHIDWPISKVVIISSIPFTVVGAVLMVRAPTLLLEQILGISVLLHIANKYLKVFPKIKFNRAMLIGTGAVYGFTTGIIGTGAVIKAAVFSHLGLRKERFIATMAVTAVAINVIKVPIFTSYGLVSRENWWLVIGFTIIALIGAQIGKLVIRRIDPHAFKKVIDVLLVITAISLLI